MTTSRIPQPGLSPDNGHRRRAHDPAQATPAPPVRLLSKAEVLRITGVSFQSLWVWMRAGKFPRARIAGVGGNSSRSVWRSDEVDEWLASLPVRRLRGDAELCTVERLLQEIATADDEAKITGLLSTNDWWVKNLSDEERERITDAIHERREASAP